MRYLSDVSNGMGSALVNFVVMDSPLAHLFLQVASRKYLHVPSSAEPNRK